MTTTRIAAPPAATAEEPRAQATRAPLRALEAAAALLAYGVLAVCLTWPLAPNLTDHTLGAPRDPLSTITWLSAVREGRDADRLGLTDGDRPGPPFAAEDLARADDRSTLVYGPTAVVAVPLGEIGAFNLLVLLGLALSGASMYWLARLLGAGWPAALWAGLAFTVLPWHLLKAEGDATLVQLEGLPLLFVAGILWFRRPAGLRLALLPAVTAALWLTSVSLGVVGTACALLLTLAGAFVLPRRLGRRAAFSAAAKTGLATALVAAAFVALAPLGPAQPADALSRYGARPWEYVLPAARNPVFGDETSGWLERHRHEAQLAETSLYVGWTTIALAAGLLLPALLRGNGASPERRFAVLSLSACLVAGLVLSLPSPLPRTDVPMPVRAIWEIEPSFGLPSRFFVLVATALVAAAGLGLEGLRRTAVTAFRSRRAGAIVGLALCLSFAGLTYLELAVARPPVVRYQGPVTAVQPPGSAAGAVLDDARRERPRTARGAGARRRGRRAPSPRPSSRRWPGRAGRRGCARTSLRPC